MARQTMKPKIALWGKIPNQPPRLMGYFKSKKEAGTYSGIWSITEDLDDINPKWYYKQRKR